MEALPDAIALFGKGETDQAIKQFLLALKLEPGYAKAHNSLGVVYFSQKNFDDAFESYHQALQNKPNWPIAQKNLELSLQGLASDILGQPFEIRNGHPDHATMHAALGNALRDQADIPEAARHYQWALNLNPNLLPALNNLAWIRATDSNSELRDGAQAVKLAERCCKLSNYKLNGTLDTLAAAYAEVGRFEDAVRWQLKAIELAGNADTTEL